MQNKKHYSIRDSDLSNSYTDLTPLTVAPTLWKSLTEQANPELKAEAETALLKYDATLDC